MPEMRNLAVLSLGLAVPQRHDVPLHGVQIDGHFDFLGSPVIGPVAHRTVLHGQSAVENAGGRQQADLNFVDAE